MKYFEEVIMAVSLGHEERQWEIEYKKKLDKTLSKKCKDKRKEFSKLESLS
jgi:hypothetical protein